MPDLSVYKNQKTLADYIGANEQQQLQQQLMQAQSAKALSDAQDMKVDQLGQQAIMKHMQGLPVSQQEAAAGQLYLAKKSGGVTKDALGNIYEKPSLSDSLGGLNMMQIPNQSPSPVSQPAAQQPPVMKQVVDSQAQTKPPLLSAFKSEPAPQQPLLNQQLPKGTAMFSPQYESSPLGMKETGDAMAKKRADAIFKNQEMLDTLTKGFASYKNALSANDQAASGALPYAADAIKNRLGFTDERSKQTASLDGAFAGINLSQAAAYLSGQGAVSDNERRLIENLAGSKLDSAPARKIKLEQGYAALNAGFQRLQLSQKYLTNNQLPPSGELLKMIPDTAAELNANPEFAPSGWSAKRIK